jgi:hypothetical protein
MQWCVPWRIKVCTSVPKEAETSDSGVSQPPSVRPTGTVEPPHLAPHPHFSRAISFLKKRLRLPDQLFLLMRHFFLVMGLLLTPIKRPSSWTPHHSSWELTAASFQKESGQQLSLPMQEEGLLDCWRRDVHSQPLPITDRNSSDPTSGPDCISRVFNSCQTSISLLPTSSLLVNSQGIHPSCRLSLSGSSRSSWEIMTLKDSRKAEDQEPEPFITRKENHPQSTGG